MRIFAPIILLCLCCGGCFKEKKTLSGRITISGRVTGFSTNTPLPNTIVHLIGVEQIHGLIGLEPREQELSTDTTDSSGLYGFAFDATGRFYEFKMVAEPLSRFYVSSFYSVGQERTKTVTKTGDNTIDVLCHRSAFAKVVFVNVAPIDTVNIGVYTQADNALIRNIYKDSIIVLKLVSRPVYPDNLRVSKFGDYILDQKLSVPAWDTTTVRINY